MSEREPGEGRPGEGNRIEIEPWDASAPTGERLQKVMAAAGVASRRVCEQYIAEGRVAVNGEIVIEPGRRVDPLVDRVTVDGVAIQLDTSRRYIMLNKPVGVVSSMSDERGRPDLTRFTRQFDERLFNVGRLDAETSGLLVLTNDGELAHVLAHPSFGVQKTYIAKVRGEVTPATIRRLQHEGVDLDDGVIVADKARLLSTERGQSLVELTLHSGRNRIVRRMLDAVGHPVLELVRRQFGPLHLGTLPAGELRDLTKVELGALLTLARSPLGGADAAGQAPSDQQSRSGASKPSAGRRGLETRPLDAPRATESGRPAKQRPRRPPQNRQGRPRS